MKIGDTIICIADDYKEDCGQPMYGQKYEVVSISDDYVGIALPNLKNLNSNYITGKVPGWHRYNFTTCESELNLPDWF